jgi:heme/copper-type cytochrome/quinol oxidase subunit 3
MSRLRLLHPPISALKHRNIPIVCRGAEGRPSRIFEQHDKAGAFRWMMITAAAGILFTLLHIRDWMGMINQGVGLFQNPWGPAAFGAGFYVVTGFSLLHISAATIALIIVAIRYRGGRYNADDMEIVNLFWQFVGLVWLFIVPVVYLMNLAR